MNDDMNDDYALDSPPVVVADAMERIYSGGLTTASGGNVSLRDRDGSIWITPARLDKGALRPELVVRVRGDGTVDGEHAPSSELPFHAAILRARPDLGAVVHAHPAALTAWAACHRTPDLAALPCAAAVCGRVVSIPYACTGTDALACRIGDTFAGGPDGTPDGALLVNHGVVVAGADMSQALVRLEVLSAAARTLAGAAALGGARTIAGTTVAPPVDAPPLAPPTSISDGEDAPRGAIWRFTARAENRGLLVGATARVSVRTDAGSILITPEGMDPDHCPAEEIRLVPGDRPQTDVGDLGLHRAVYAAHEHVRAIITAAPVSATAFGLTGADLDCRMLSESYLVLGRVPRVPWSTGAGHVSAAAGTISRGTPAALLEHRGVLATGGSLLEAFDVLEVLESTAAALIEARLVGALVPIPDEDVADLEALR